MDTDMDRYPPVCKKASDSLSVLFSSTLRRIKGACSRFKSQHGTKFYSSIIPQSRGSSFCGCACRLKQIIQVFFIYMHIYVYICVYMYICIFKVEVKIREVAVLSLEENTARVNAMWVKNGRRKVETVI